VRFEIRERRVDHIRDHDEIDRLIRIVHAHASRHVIFRHGQLFVRHPSGYFDDFIDVRVHVARVFNDGAKAIENGATNRLGPAQKLV
jgi:hypothetical protein